MLLGRVPRQDREAIVKEVETQIHELLHENDRDEPGRDDALAVLVLFDPPEAYLPEDSPSPSPIANSAQLLRVSQSARTKQSQNPRAGGIIGRALLVEVLLLPPLVWAIAVALKSEWLGLVGLPLTCAFGFPRWCAGDRLGCLGLPAWFLGRYRGIVTGCFTAAVSLIGGCVLMLVLFG